MAQAHQGRRLRRRVQVLESWKEIRRHLAEKHNLCRSVRTLQRWRRKGYEGFPVQIHEDLGSAYALAHELAAWVRRVFPGA